MNFIGILVGLLILGLMMTVHELGHYLVGRKLGFTILEFQIFMGPRLFTWEKNGIKYSLRLLPIGAAVQFAGEYPEPGEALKPGDFYERPKRYRAAVLIAGAAVNILTGIIAFFIMFSSTGYNTTTLANIAPDSVAARAGLASGDRLVSIDGAPIRTDLDLTTALTIAPLDEAVPVKYIDHASGEESETTWTQTLETSYLLGITIDGTKPDVHVMSINEVTNPAVSALEVGDVIEAVNGQAVDVTTLSNELKKYGDTPFELRVNRNGTLQNVTMTAVPQEGLSPSGIQLVPSNHVMGAIPHSVKYAWSLMTSNVKLLGQMFSGRIAARDSLTGPVGIVQIFSGVVANNQVDIGARLMQLLSLFGLISVALGFTNLLPIPPLDGNQLLLTGVEAIRGKRLSVRTQNIVTIVGVVIIIGLALLALFFDVSRIIGG